jgi:hypothetical protein
MITWEKISRIGQDCLFTKKADRADKGIMQVWTGGAGIQIDFSSVVTKVQTKDEARALPTGSIVGDKYGGVTFSDAIAAELEKRSRFGWRDVVCSEDQSRWTVIILNR